MILNSLIGINSIIFILISLLHFYWAFGGKWAIDYAVPDKFQEVHFHSDNRLKTAIATIIVAIGLLLFSAITASNYFNIESLLAPKWTIILTRIIAGIFLLRAIGDFNLFGLFRKEAVSKFGQKDRQIFTPLCLYLGLTLILITL